MAEIVVCDLCESKEPLGKGSYAVVVRRYLKRDDESESCDETEFDVCISCMAKIRQAGLK